ncbi:NAD-dependent epimerase/dehydratase family protein [Nocardioides zeae]
MHVVVAGSSGFLGQALVRALRERDHRVTRLVRRDSPPRTPRAGTPTRARSTPTWWAPPTSW